MALLLETPVHGRRTCSFPDELDILRAYGLEVQPRVDEIFDIYKDSGFLYPQKSETLTPFWSSIRQLWNRLMEVKPPLLVAGIEGRHKRSTGAIWRSTKRNWFLQHLASKGDAFGTASLVMGAIAALYLPGEADGFQVWFRGDNKLPNRLFGSVLFEGTPGNQDSAARTYNYCIVRKSDLKSMQFSGLEVMPCDDSTASVARALVAEARGTAFVNVEELEADPFLTAIDAQFQCEGVRRYRQIYVALKANQPVACAIAFRGPLGLNFSFLENRCDLVLKPGLKPSESSAIVEALLSHVVDAYSDFEPEWIPITTETPVADLPAMIRPIRAYTQAICLRPAMPRFYDGLRGIYTRLLARQMRLGTFAVRAREDSRAEVASRCPAI
jgi:hypothetical protein